MLAIKAGGVPEDQPKNDQTAFEDVTSLRASLQRFGLANQEVASRLPPNLTDHHLIPQHALSRGQLRSIRQEAGCRIKDMGYIKLHREP